MFTRIAPTCAVAYWIIGHSAVFGDQIPIRSPGLVPRSISAVAIRRVAS